MLALPQIVRLIRAGWYENLPKWRVLPRNREALGQLVAPIPSSLGLANPDCSVMPILVFMRDHRAESIDRVLASVERFAGEQRAPGLSFKLASGNVGVMAATNAEIRARESGSSPWW